MFTQISGQKIINEMIQSRKLVEYHVNLKDILFLYYSLIFRNISIFVYCNEEMKTLLYGKIINLLICPLTLFT